MQLPEALLDLLHAASPCFVATVMPDGSPQVTQTWVDTDGTHILVNVVQGMQKARNIERDDRVAVNVCDPDNINKYFAVRGRVVAATTDGAREHIDKLSHKYLGRPYPNFSGSDRGRLLLTIKADSISSPRG